MFCKRLKLKIIIKWNAMRLFKKKIRYMVIILAVHVPMVSGAVAATESLVPQTGQTASYDDRDDGALEQGVALPRPRFIDNQDGTLTDKLTNLIWLQDADCIGDPLDWQAALDMAQSLENGECGLSDGSGQGDWRLPNIRELDSLVHEGFHNPTLSNRNGDGAATTNDPFANFNASYTHWSSTTRVDNPAYAFAVDFEWGNVKSNLKTSKRTALFVRDNTSGSALAPVFATHQSTCYDSAGEDLDCAGTGQDGDVQSGLAWPVPRFKDNGDGTITDYLSGLVWLKNSSCFGNSLWSDALETTNALEEGQCGLTDNSAQGNWRMANRRELYSLIDFNSSYPAISNSKGDEEWDDDDPFTNVKSLSYWSSTSYDGNSANARTIHIGTSQIGVTGKTVSGYFWPVRHGEITRTLRVAIRGQGGGRVVSTPEGIDCPGDCEAAFEYLSTVELTATSLPGSRFDHWSDPLCGASRTCSVVVQGETQTISAYFEEAQGMMGWLMLLLFK